MEWNEIYGRDSTLMGKNLQPQVPSEQMSKCFNALGQIVGSIPCFKQCPIKVALNVAVSAKNS